MMTAASYAVLIGGVPVPTSRQALPRTCSAARSCRCSALGELRGALPAQPNPVQYPLQDNAQSLHSSLPFHARKHGSGASQDVEQPIQDFGNHRQNAERR